ncbi:Prenylated rab acceptor 1 [Handroanthus impetiginosus]|uniref:PRA1 family protein n=1 Tax=Handroanthus impetiginosus TaxID=429701 RepID=A0A2G9GKW8_9LAMI|nr:Prenylated rab acceptor 1 [Handroanthus impetiginosus]
MNVLQGSTLPSSAHATAPYSFSSSRSGTLVNLDYVSHTKESLKASLGTHCPWREMFQLHSFNLPKSFCEVVAHVKTNLGYFWMNYAIVVLLILFLSLLWQPISLIIFIAMMAAWFFLYFLCDEPLVIFGWLITDRVLLVGVVVVLIHAVVRKTDDLFADEEAAGGLLRSSGGPSSS